MDIDRRDFLTGVAVTAAAAPLAGLPPIRVFDAAKLAIKQHDGPYPPKTSVFYDGICLGRCDDPPLADLDKVTRRAPIEHWAKMVAELFSRGGDRLDEDTYGAPSTDAPPLAR